MSNLHLFDAVSIVRGSSSWREIAPPIVQGGKPLLVSEALRPESFRALLRVRGRVALLHVNLPWNRMSHSPKPENGGPWTDSLVQDSDWLPMWIEPDHLIRPTPGRLASLVGTDAVAGTLKGGSI